MNEKGFAVYSESRTITKPKVDTLRQTDFHLLLPEKTADQALLLFGGFSETPEDVLNESDLVRSALNANIPVLISTLNRKLWWSTDDLNNFEEAFFKLLAERELIQKSWHIGGFSSGGNLAIMLSNHLSRNKKFKKPIGVFVVDSPLDLERL